MKIGISRKILQKYKRKHAHGEVFLSPENKLILKNFVNEGNFKKTTQEYHDKLAELARNTAVSCNLGLVNVL
jgi:hypothetical protein